MWKRGSCKRHIPVLHYTWVPPPPPGGGGWWEGHCWLNFELKGLLNHSMVLRYMYVCRSQTCIFFPSKLPLGSRKQKLRKFQKLNLGLHVHKCRLYYCYTCMHTFTLLESGDIWLLAWSFYRKQYIMIAFKVSLIMIIIFIIELTASSQYNEINSPCQLSIEVKWPTLYMCKYNGGLWWVYRGGCAVKYAL